MKKTKFRKDGRAISISSLTRGGLTAPNIVNKGVRRSDKLIILVILSQKGRLKSR